MMPHLAPLLRYVTSPLVTERSIRNKQKDHKLIHTHPRDKASKSCGKRGSQSVAGPDGRDYVHVREHVAATS